MRQCQERFVREERALQQRVQNCRQEVAKTAQQIEQLKAIKDTRDALLRELQAKAEGSRWQKLPARFKLDDLSVLQEAVEDGATRLTQHVGRLPWLARVSIASLNREAKQLSEVIKEMVVQKDLAKKNSTALERTKTRLVEVEDELKVLRRLREYHVESDALSLLGCSTILKEKKAKVTQLKEATILLRAVDLKKFEGCATTLNEMDAQQEADIIKRRRNLTKLKARST